MSLHTGMGTEFQSCSMTAGNCLALIALLHLLSAHLTGTSICPSDFSVRVDITNNYNQ